VEQRGARGGGPAGLSKLQGDMWGGQGGGRAAGERGSERRRCPAPAEREEEEGGHQGLSCNLPKMHGVHCKPRIPTKLGLKWKSYQNKSCRVFQDLQLSFKDQGQEIKGLEYILKTLTKFRFKKFSSFHVQISFNLGPKNKFPCHAIMTNILQFGP
jgi:hypothetical protein